MTCGFCGNDVSAERMFTGVQTGGRADRICCDCVLDLYVVMTASAMHPMRPVRDRPRPTLRLARVIRLYPRKGD